MKKLRLMAMAVLWMGTPGLLAAPDKMEPPGDCTKEKHRALQQEVNRACKGQKMRCEPWDDCVTLERNLMLFEDCIKARRAIMDQCFKGGDDDHLNQLELVLRGHRRCVGFIDCNCR